MEEELEVGKDRNAEALKSGVILGLISTIVTILIYISDISLLADWKLGLSMSVLSLAFVIYMGRKFRLEETDGFLSYKESFYYSFVVFFISSVISAAFLILLYEVIDPEVSRVLADQAIENTEKMMRNFGAPEEQIDQSLEELDGQMIESFSAVGVMENSWVYFISSTILGAICAIFIKKSRPEFE